MKIGFVSRLDPLDKKSWSGIDYYTWQEIKKYYEVEFFNYKLPKYLQEYLTTQKSFNKNLFNKNTSVEFLKSYAKNLSKQLEADLKKRPVDLLFVAGSSQMIAYLKTDIPIIYLTDATFQQLESYYPSFSNLAKYNIKQGIELDKRAFQKASHCMLSSDWNKLSAINDYGIDSSKISVVQLGANLDNVPAISELKLDCSVNCRLLFLGVEWNRKGGDIALDAFRILQGKGINTQLHIVGCIPPYDFSGEKNITVIPFIDKNKKDDFLKLHEIFLETDFLLLPTRAECAGMIFCEGSAYGIPSITTDTGGVTSYILNDINGYALPYSASGEAYAETVSKIFSDKQLFRKLHISSRQYFDNHLNWTVWGEKFNVIAKHCLMKS